MQSGRLKSFRTLFQKVNLRARKQSEKEQGGEKERVRERGRERAAPETECGQIAPENLQSMRTKQSNTQCTRNPTSPPPTLQQSTRRRLVAVVCVCVRVCASVCECGGPIAERENIIYSICDSSSLCPTCLIKIAV